MGRLWLLGFPCEEASLVRIPPFCPNPSCPRHGAANPAGIRASDPLLEPESWFEPHGEYRTKAYGHVPRFRCRWCGRTFSTQTFSTRYYLKRPAKLKAVFLHTCEGMSGRAIGRILHLSPRSVQNRVERLARQALALHQTLRRLADPHQAVCIDGVVSFDGSQYFPSELTIGITVGSRYIFEASHASRRRSGTMTDAQCRKARSLYARVKTERGGVRRTFREILDSLARERPPSTWHPLVLITDEKPEYKQVLHRHPLFVNQDEGHRVAQVIVHSSLPRTMANPLFASNYLERELRKDLANHRRETTCFSRRVANGLSRYGCYQAYHNYWKRFRINAPAADRRVHADLAGIPPRMRRQAMLGFFSERRFLSHQVLSPPLERIWRMAASTPGQETRRAIPHFILS